MTKAQWKRKIKRQCEEIGTYRPAFDGVISGLAEILEEWERAKEQFEQTGGRPVVQFEKDGAPKKNPTLRALEELRTQALAYWRDLGLTPAGYKKLNADVVGDKGAGGFEKLLEKLM